MLEFISLSLEKSVFILIPLLPAIKHCKQNAQQSQISSNRMWLVGAVVIKMCIQRFLGVAKIVLFFR